MSNSPAPILAIIADNTIRTELAELLSGTDFAILFADSAEQGLRKAEELLPAVIVIDRDPALNTLETCRRLRSNPVLSNLLILMLCDRDDRDARAAGLNAGADDFLEKPFDGIELYSRLRTVTRLNTYRLLLADLTRFSWMVEYAQEGYLMLDKAGGVIYANERAQHLLNLPENHMGLPFSQVVERIFVPEPAETWQHWQAEPEPCFLIQPESPTARAVWVVLEALDTPIGVEYHRIVRLRDVTERMSIYQDMRRFHTVVAHKLRTPMSVMMSSLSLLNKRIEMLSPEEIRNFARTAIGGAERLSNEIREILTYIDAPLALNLGAPLRLGQLPNLVENVCKSLNLTGVHLFLPDPLINHTLAITPDALEMVLFELLENSRKFHPQHTPRVDISVGETEIGFIQIRVTDNGMNLSTEQLSWAWLPYFQGEKDFTGELPGLGLGFPMVATLVWKSGGDLHLRNHPNGPGVIVDMKIPLESTMRKVERSAAPFQG